MYRQQPRGGSGISKNVCPCRKEHVSDRGSTVEPGLGGLDRAQLACRQFAPGALSAGSTFRPGRAGYETQSERFAAVPRTVAHLCLLCNALVGLSRRSCCGCTLLYFRDTSVWSGSCWRRRSAQIKPTLDDNQNDAGGFPERHPGLKELAEMRPELKRKAFTMSKSCIGQVHQGQLDRSPAQY